MSMGGYVNARERMLEDLLGNNPGDYKEVPHPFLKVWDLLKEGKADATCGGTCPVPACL